MISRVEASYDSRPDNHSYQWHQFAIELYEEIETTILDHAVLSEELANDINGPSALKHLKQQVR